MARIKWTARKRAEQKKEEVNESVSPPASPPRKRLRETNDDATPIADVFLPDAVNTMEVSTPYSSSSPSTPFPNEAVEAAAARQLKRAKKDGSGGPSKLLRFNENQTRRRVTAAKRSHGILKKFQELQQLTGMQVFCVLQARPEDSVHTHVYTSNPDGDPHAHLLSLGKAWPFLNVRTHTVGEYLTDRGILFRGEDKGEWLGARSSYVGNVPVFGRLPPEIEQRESEAREAQRSQLQEPTVAGFVRQVTSNCLPGYNPQEAASRLLMDQRELRLLFRSEADAQEAQQFKVSRSGNRGRKPAKRDATRPLLHRLTNASEVISPSAPQLGTGATSAAAAALVERNEVAFAWFRREFGAKISEAAASGPIQPSQVVITHKEYFVPSAALAAAPQAEQKANNDFDLINVDTVITRFAAVDQQLRGLQDFLNAPPQDLPKPSGRVTVLPPAPAPAAAAAEEDIFANLSATMDAAMAASSSSSLAGNGESLFSFLANNPEIADELEIPQDNLLAPVVGLRPTDENLYYEETLRYPMH